MMQAEREQLGGDGTMPPPAPQTVHRKPRGDSPLSGNPTPRKLTKMSSKYRLSSGNSPAGAAAARGATPVVVLDGKGGLTPSLSTLEGQRSNPATPLFSPDTDAAFAALAATAPNSAAATVSTQPAAVGAGRPPNLSEDAGVSPRAMALAKAARLAQQRAGEGSPSSEEARDLNAQLEAASRTRLSDVGTERDHPDTGATDMLSPPARSSMLSPSVGCSSRRKKSPAVRWSAAVEPSPAAAAKKPPEIVESVAVVRGPQTPVQQDSAMAVGGSLSPSPSGKWWREMREEEHAAAVLMGWDEKSWDAGDRAPFKAVWSEMGELRQRAAMIFKFGPEHFAKPTKVHTWAGHDGWTYKRGSGLVTFLYIAPDGRVFTSERDAQQAYDVSQGHSPRGSAVSDSDSESSQQQASKPSPPHRSPARSPILSPKSSKLAQATETDSQDAGAYWANMNKLQQTAAEMLGWSSQSWDDGDDTPFRKVWVEMTDDEHSAALMLNFEQEHFAKPKKPKDKKGKAWPEHEGWWIRRGTGLINWIYTGPDGTEYTDEQEALQAADAAADDSDLMAETFCEDQTDFDRGIDGCGSRRERVEPKHGVKQQHADSFTSPLPSAATAGEDSAAAQPSPKAVGDFVEANYMGLGTFHGGVIKTQHPDGTFAVSYHDGDYEENVERANIRALRKRRRVPRTDLDTSENAVASREKAVAAKGVAASREKAKPEKAKPKKATPKPAPPRGPTAAQRKRVAQALRKAAESVAECSDRSIDDKLGWLWTALVGYKSAEESVSGMDLLQHISSSGSEQGTADLGARRHSALFSPSENCRGPQRGAATPAGTPHSAQHNEKAFMWERLDGKTWRQLPDGNTWQRDGLVVLWTPCTALTKTLPELDKLVFELKCNGKSVTCFSGASGEVRQGRQGKEECFVVITEAQLRECGEGVGEVLVWNSDGTPDPNNDSGIKLEDTMTGLPLDGVAAEASQGASAEDASFPPTSGLQVDMICDAQDTAGGWNPVRIKALREDTDGVKQVKVHFLGWNERHDKWMSITAGQLAPAGTMSTDAESSSRHRWNGRRESSSGSPDAPVGVERAMEFEEEVLEIAQIVQARQSEPEDGGGMQYKIRYKGSDAADDIWVAEDELAEMGARDKLNKFHEREKKKAEKKAAIEKKKMADAKRKADLERRKEQQRLKKELLEAEKEAAEAAANAARLIEQKRSQLAQVQSQRGKAKAGAASACGTKRKQSAAALSDNSNVAAKSHSEKGTDYVGRRLVRLVAGLTKGKIVNYKEASDTYEILFKDKDRLELTLDQIVHGGIVQLTANKRPNFTSVEMSQRF